jgi:hypothetical protein
MATHPNTFETVKEAMMRLRRTVVVYDGQPFVVLCITNHKADGIFRIYLQATGLDPNKSIRHGQSRKAFRRSIQASAATWIRGWSSIPM